MSINDKIKKYLNEGKINNPDYEWWVVVNGKIVSGWEYEEDAADAVKDLPRRMKGEVYDREELEEIDLNPDNDKDWGSGV